MKSLMFAITAAGLLTSGVCFAQATQAPDPGKTTPTITGTGTPTVSGRPAVPGAPTVSGTASQLGSTANGTAHRANDAATINSNQAVATTSANAAMPAKGANSFTMNEAKARMQRDGYANVDNLSKDNDGIWRGKAQKDGMSTNVWLDYKGNIGVSK